MKKKLEGKKLRKGRVQLEVEAKRKIEKGSRILSVYEIEVITDNVKKNLDLIQSKLTNAVTNKKKQMLWEEITQVVNVV